MGCFLYPWLQGCTAKCCSRFDSGCRGFLFATRMGGLYLSLLEEGQTVALLPKEEKNKEEVKICYLRFCLMEKSEHPQAIWSAFPRRILCRIWSMLQTYTIKYLLWPANEVQTKSYIKNLRHGECHGYTVSYNPDPLIKNADNTKMFQKLLQPLVNTI